MSSDALIGMHHVNPRRQVAIKLDWPPLSGRVRIVAVSRAMAATGPQPPRQKSPVLPGTAAYVHPWHNSQNVYFHQQWLHIPLPCLDHIMLESYVLSSKNSRSFAITAAKLDVKLSLRLRLHMTRRDTTPAKESRISPQVH